MMPSCRNRSEVVGVINLNRLLVDGVAATAAYTVILLITKASASLHKPYSGCNDEHAAVASGYQLMPRKHLVQEHLDSTDFCRGKS